MLSGNQVQIRIRTMARGDLEAAGLLLYEAFNREAVNRGYPARMENVREGVSWAWTLLRNGQSTPLVADADGSVAGVCCLNARGEVGGVGPVAVSPSFQGKGLGRQLMNELLQRASGLKSLRLYQEAFNPSSFSLYYSFDFMPVAELLDLSAAPAGRGQSACSRVSEVPAKDIDPVCAYDTPRSKLDRRIDLANYAAWGKLFALRDGSGVRGYLACLPGARSVQMGPLVAEGEEEAALLFSHALQVFHDRPCQTRAMAKDRMLVRNLQGAGFKVSCLNLLMVRGSWRPGPFCEAFGRFPEGA